MWWKHFSKGHSFQNKNDAIDWDWVTISQRLNENTSTCIFICTPRQSPDFSFFMQLLWRVLHANRRRSLSPEHKVSFWNTMYKFVNPRVRNYSPDGKSDYFALPFFTLTNRCISKPFQDEIPRKQQFCQQLLRVVCCLFGKVKITNTFRFLCRVHVWHKVYCTDYIMHRSLLGI